MSIARSITHDGFKPEETIVARDCKPGMAANRFGDGMKRGLAAKLVFFSCTLIVVACLGGLHTCCKAIKP